MPAADSHLTLDEVEKATLIRWIEQGAEWKPHWAFMPPATPALPAVATSGWARGEIDRFVLAATRGEGLEALARSAARDLDAARHPRSDAACRRRSGRGRRLPRRPAPATPTSASSIACSRRRATASAWPPTGWTSRATPIRTATRTTACATMWPWRDWVIAAFNRNLRVDEFTTWQLAGDLLPNPTQEQLIATGFNRNHMQSQEGGIVAEEYRTEYVVDRVNTLGRALLGLSVECARCHDHKYDPISQREFYQLYAFFNNVNEVGQIPYSGVPSPTAIVTTPKVDARLAELAARITALEAELDPTRRATTPASRAGSRPPPTRRARPSRSARPRRPLPVRRTASGDRTAQGRSEEAEAAGKAAGRQEAAQADPGARQRRGRQGARARRRHRSPDEDGARQGRRRAAAGRRQLRRSREDGRVLRAQRAVRGGAWGPAWIAPARPVRCSPDRAA